MILNEVQEEIVTGESRINDLRTDLNGQFEELIENIERKLSRSNQKYDTFVLKVENKF